MTAANFWHAEQYLDLENTVCWGLFRGGKTPSLDRHLHVWARGKLSRRDHEDRCAGGCAGAYRPYMP